MKKANQLFALGFLLFLASACPAQTNTISGIITDSITGLPLPSASITIKETGSGTFTDQKGRFSLQTILKAPLTLIISNAGYSTKEDPLANLSKEVNVQMQQAFSIGETVVVGGTKAPLKSLRSPVSIETFDRRKILNSPSLSYYDVAATLKGVDVTTSSLTFKTISTRGFNGSGSTRVNQVVDGMDNQAPGLNFFVGNFAGLIELDVDNVELLPGASSALYGPGGMNGTILINSKSPFKYQGLSVQAKQGVMHIGSNQRDNASPFFDYSLRWAKAFKNKFAIKIGAQYITAKDWVANDTSDYQSENNLSKVVAGNRRTDPNYNGVNVYGDETSVDIRPFIAPYIPGLPDKPIYVSRTGYDEKNIVDPVTKNLKLSAALHYKINDRLEAQVMGYWANGNTVYTGSNRYALKDIKIGQYKFELKHRDWMLRAYTTQEDAGQAYTATAAARVLNELWKPSYNPNDVNGSWYPQYSAAFLTALQNGADQASAHNIARSFADQGRPLPGSQQFQQLFDVARKTPLPQGGLFLEKSQLWMGEAQYNFSHVIKFAEIIIGASWKRYTLNSKGTLFIDTLKPIGVNETGAYAQVTKHLLKDVLTLSASGRYDKNGDFKGKFTPRFTALVKIVNNNFLRLSYQTAYRFPSNQQKFIRLNVGDYTLLGGLPWVKDYMGSKNDVVVEVKNGVPESTPYVYKEFKPESSNSFEIGYKGLIAERLLIDAYGYFGSYKDFLGRNLLVNTSTGQLFSTVVNSDNNVKTHGFGLGLDYQLQKNFTLFFNSYSDVITKVPSGFQSYFNAPKYRVNAGFTNSGAGKNKRIGYGMTLHWQDAFLWDGELANGPVNAFTTIDAQVSYKLPKLGNSMIKLGASNLLNHYYKTGYGNPETGGIYYLSVAYNIL
jgi:outer membrane receptor protein involved in Fe transport